MQATEYLNQVKMIDRKIKNKKVEIEMLKSMATNIGAGASDCERVQTSGNSDKIGNAVVKICAAEEELADLVEIYIQKQKHISNSLDAIHDVNIYDVMHMKYIQFMDIREIADKMGYTEQWIFTMHRAGLNEIQKRLDNLV